MPERTHASARRVEPERVGFVHGRYRPTGTSITYDIARAVRRSFLDQAVEGIPAGSVTQGVVSVSRPILCRTALLVEHALENLSDGLGLPDFDRWQRRSGDLLEVLWPGHVLTLRRLQRVQDHAAGNHDDQVDDKRD